MIALARALGVVVVGALATSCFSGEGTLGGVCEQSSDCGDAQRCERSICGSCGDGIAQAGEVCLGAAEVALELAGAPGAVPTPQAIDLDSSGRRDLVWASAEGVGVALAEGGGFSMPRFVGSETSAVWTGVGPGGGPAVLSRDSAGAAILWTPDASGALSTDDAVALDALQGLRAAVLTEQLGVVAALGDTLHFATPDAPEMATHEVAVGAEAQALLGPLDLDGDGIEDLYVWTTQGQAVAVHGRGEAAPVVGQTVTFSSPPHDIVATAWNRDTRTDLVVLGEDRDVRVLLAADAEDEPPIEVQRVRVAAGARHVLVADVNGDTDPDVVVYGPEAGRMWVLLARGAELDAPVVLEEEGDAVWVGVFNVGTDPFVDVLRQRGGALDLFEGAP